MALGQLIVRLGLDATDFVAGLTDSERRAQRFGDVMSNQIAAGVIKAEIAMKAFGKAVDLAGQAFQTFTAGTANFKDLEEKTGAQAEALASFAVSAEVAGASMESLGTFAIKMSKNLAVVTDESKPAGAALAALGIPLKEFKALDPAGQIELVAQALAKFNDIGGGKAAALESIAKGGAQLLPFFKELEASGGRQVILTQRQIEQADEYIDRQARTRAELVQYAQAAATFTLPAITALINASKEFVGELVNIDTGSKKLRDGSAIESWAESAALKLAFIVDAGQAVTRIFSVIGESIGARAAQLRALLSGDLKQAAAIGDDATERLTAKLAAPLFSQQVEKEIKRLRDERAQRAREDRGFDPRHAVNFAGADKGDKAARTERLSDAERYLQNLQRQLEATHDLSAAEKVVVDIMSGRLKLSNGITEDMLIGVAQQIDQAREEEKARRDVAKAIEEEARARRRAEDAAISEVTKLGEGNEALRDEIAIITGGVEARKAIEKARLSSAIALKEDTLAQRENAGASDIEIFAIQEQIRLLKERSGLLVQRDFAEKFAADAELIKRHNEDIANSFADQFSAVVTGEKSASQALRDFAKNVERMITDIASKNIAKAIFGDTASGGAGGFNFGAILQALFGGGGGSGLNTVNGFSGFGVYGGGAFASGGRPEAGKASWVGERGRELFVPDVAGTILPNSMLRGGMGGNTTVNVYVPQGTSRASSTQIAADTVRKLQQAKRVT